ncbi:MAG: trypsin-like peptidase protein, partial [Actinomycetota bacterium]|nr:trypsin-like peptidase protein [Actinomycetota bacterium]
MSRVGLADRLVEVIGDLGPTSDPRYCYGSGCVINGRIVLTAAHIVRDSVGITVRLADKRGFVATVELTGDGDGVDLALLSVEDEDFPDLPRMPLGRVIRDSRSGHPIPCRAVGYPKFARRKQVGPGESEIRDTEEVGGQIRTLGSLALGLLRVQVTSASQELPGVGELLSDSPWEGMSGAPVTHGDYLVGVVIEHAPASSPSELTALPITCLVADPEHPSWGEGVAGPERWSELTGSRLPQEIFGISMDRREARYWATVRELGLNLHRNTPMLIGREEELHLTSMFSTGGPGYLWWRGGAWSGKTALLHEFATARAPENVDVVCFFVSRRAGQNTREQFLQAVVPQLAVLCDVETPAQLNENEFRGQWEDATRKAREANRHLLLMVDGLDEDFYYESRGSAHGSGGSIAALLPTSLDVNCHVIVSSRFRPDPPVDLPARHPLVSREELQEHELSRSAHADQMQQEAKQELHDLLNGDDEWAIDVLGCLAAAQGALSINDIDALCAHWSVRPGARRLYIDNLVNVRAARSFASIGRWDQGGYVFAH